MQPKFESFMDKQKPWVLRVYIYIVISSDADCYKK